MITEKNLVKHELIGLNVEICKSTNKDQIGINGNIIDETRNMLIIETKNGTKFVEKKNCVFIFSLQNQIKVEVNGEILVARPEDRIKKKFKKW